jgi:hypothetical protein
MIFVVFIFIIYNYILLLLKMFRIRIFSIFNIFMSVNYFLKYSYKNYKI